MIPLRRARLQDLSGKADLVAGKVPFPQLPAIVVGELFPVASQAAMLALTAQIGDVAVRTDLANKRFLLLGTSTTLADWKSIDDVAAGGVTTVNGQSGVVVLAAADVGALAASRLNAANGAAGLGPDGLLLPAQRPPSSGGAPATFLSTIVVPNIVLADRTPLPASFATFGERTYAVFTPTQDAVVSGLRDVNQTLNMPCTPYVFRISNGALIASGPAVARTGVSADYVYTTPVTLLTGVAYAIGIDTPAGTTPASLGRTATGPTGTYPGFTVGADMLYGGVPGSAPTTPFAGRSPTWSILTPGTQSQKNVTGPLDSLDFPVVVALANLPANAAAIFDPGTAAPRLVRKRADGTVWYGTLFTSVP